MEKNTAKKLGWNYFWLAMTAFGGLGLEILWAFLIEPMIYGAPMQEWTTVQNILHWTITCVTWGLVALWVGHDAKKSCGFSLMEKGEPMKLWQWAAALGCVVVAVGINYLDWGGFKVIKEFQNKTLPVFVFQYIYYAFETVLFMLIVVFGQKLCETMFQKRNIPYGGIVCGLTWGLAHIFTKGSLVTGLNGLVYGFLFGVAYLVVRRDIKKTWLLLFLMFAF